MDDHLTTGQAAKELGTSVPRLLRAVKRGLVPTRRKGNRTLFPRTSVAELRKRWGWVPPIDDLTRQEVFVLAAVSRRPRGLRSTRAVARAARVSPTTATAALHRLEGLRLVCRTQVREAAGRVRDVTIWEIDWTSRRWQRIAGRIGEVVIPESPRPAASRRVPGRLAHLFWNEDLADLDLDEHGSLIADRILRADDPEALAWAAEALPSEAFARAARKRGLDSGSRGLAEVLAAR